MNNLAGLYRVLSRYAKAEALYKRALALWEIALGPDDPNVVTVLENLAELYIKLGKKNEAEKLEQRAHEIRSHWKSAIPDDKTH